MNSNMDKEEIRKTLRSSIYKISEMEGQLKSLRVTIEGLETYVTELLDKNKKLAFVSKQITSKNFTDTIKNLENENMIEEAEFLKKILEAVR